MVHKNFEETLEASAMLVKTQNNGWTTNSKAAFKKKEAEKKEDIFCEHCKVHGNLKNCFNLNGYLNRYVELLKNKKEKKTAKQINMTDAITDQEKFVDSKQ